MLKINAGTIQKLKTLDVKKADLSDIQEVFANLDDTDENGLTLLHWAVKLRLENIIDIFLKNRHLINIDAVDNQGDTALHLAAELYKKDPGCSGFNIIEKLLINSENYTENKHMQILLDFCIDSNMNMDFVVMDYVSLIFNQDRFDIFVQLVNYMLSHVEIIINEKSKFEYMYFLVTARVANNDHVVGAKGIKFIKLLLDRGLITKHFIKTGRCGKFFDQDGTVLAWVGCVHDLEFIKGLLDLGIINKEDIKTYTCDDNSDTIFHIAMSSFDKNCLATADNEKFLEFLLHINYNWLFIKNDTGVNFLENKRSFWEGSFNDFIKRMIESILINAEFGSFKEKIGFVKQCSKEFPEIYSERDASETCVRLQLKRKEEEKLLAVQQETKEGSPRTLKREYEVSTTVMTNVITDAKRIKTNNLNASQDPPQQL